MKLFSFILISLFLINSSFSNEEEENGKILSRQKRLLVYPQFSVLQLGMALVAKVSYINSHVVAVNTGFSLNYALPFNAKGFYNPVFFPVARSIANGTSLLESYFNKLIENTDDEKSQETTSKIEESPEIEETTEINEEKRTKRDISAGEFYSGMNDAFTTVGGYHEDCLLKSICELAKHPLIDHEGSVVYEALHFILTPSVHQSFDKDESLERKIYEEAENFGKLNGNCELKYNKCNQSQLDSISDFVTLNDDE